MARPRAAREAVARTPSRVGNNRVMPFAYRTARAVAMAVALASLVAGLVGCDPPGGDIGRWRPKVGDTWQIQLSGTPAISFDVDVYDIDLFDVPKATINRLHRDGRRVVCYFSAGSYEPWRPDAARLPRSVRGEPLDPPFDEERWLDIRSARVLAVMVDRMDLARDKGCDGVDPDNVEGWDNDTGFDLTRSDQAAFNRSLADAAHARGLAIGLKNDLGQVAGLVRSFDFAVNEQCHQYRECAMLAPFVDAGKPVFGIEYRVTRSEFCPESRRRHHSTLRKRLNLGPYRRACAWEM